METPPQDDAARLRGLFEWSGAGIAITDLRGRFLDANPAFCATVGYSVEELRERDFLSITHPDDRATNQAAMDALRRGEIPSFTLEKRYLAKGGRAVWVRITVSMVRDDDGQPQHTTATTEDITDAKLAAERFERSRSLQRMAGELARVGGWSVGVDGSLDWSDEIFRILEYPPGEEPRLQETLALYPPEHLARVQPALDACLQDGEPFDLELEVRTATGRRLPIRVVAEAERGPDGGVRRVIGALQDLSASRAAAEQVEAANRRLTATLESMTDALYAVDERWDFTYLNGRAEELLQRSRTDLLGRNIWEAFPDAVGTEIYHAYHRAMREGATQVVEEYYYPPLDRWFSVNAYPGEQGLTVYFRDVSRRRQDRRELERQAFLLDAAQDAIAVRDMEHRVTYWNRGAEQVYGYSADEALGRDVRELIGASPEVLRATGEALFRDGEWAGENEQHTRAGERILVYTRLTLLRDDRGEPEAVLAINTDVTEHRQAEQQMLRAQRMESLGTLAGGVAHDLNNVLSPILLATELLREQDLDDGGHDLLTTIGKSARRGADLVSQVLSFSRGVEGERSPVDMAELLDDVRAIVRDTFPKNLRLKMQLPDDLGTVTGDSTQLQQVLLNLAVNARDAMPDGGTLTITAAAVSLDAEYTSRTPGSVEGEYLRIDVEDDGTGMPPEVRERVFEPFFTTKPQGAGTGLGLSTAAAIVRSHDGFINVYSELGRGSQFRLYLPLAKEPTSPVVTSPTDHELPRGRGETILVVDDEVAVRKLTRQILETFGYRVLEASDGAEAVSVFAQHRREIAAVITDMMMPVMDGPTTIIALQRIEPTVRVIAASGLHANGKVAQASNAGVRHFLPKPYSSRELLEMLRELLDRAPPSE